MTLIKRKWDSIYSNRHTSVEKAISHIRSSQKVFMAPFCNEPMTLVEELVRQKERLSDVTIYNAVIGSPCLYADPSCHPHFQIRTFLSSPLLKSAYMNQVCDYLPVNLFDIPEWITREKLDVSLIQITPPNEDGYCNLGISVDVIHTLIKNSNYVIAEVNSQVPRTCGDTLVHVSEINAFVSSDRPLISLPTEKPSEIELKIGNHVASLIPDKATIQVGVGKLAEGILLSLNGKKSLGIHSGSISNQVMELMENGVVTNEFKEVNRFKTVCTTLTGTEELYNYANFNKSIELHPVTYTHNALVISKINQFHSINSALEVDIFGQVNAEQVGFFPIGGVGGQMDFIRGAKLSKGGKSIIALPSTAKRGTQSRIKFSVTHTTTLKSEIDYIVTEYGIAKLTGQTLFERAKQLISIAHPDFRQSLTDEIEEYLVKRTVKH